MSLIVTHVTRSYLEISTCTFNSHPIIHDFSKTLPLSRTSCLPSQLLSLNYHGIFYLFCAPALTGVSNSAKQHNIIGFNAFKMLFSSKFLCTLGRLNPEYWFVQLSSCFLLHIPASAIIYMPCPIPRQVAVATFDTIRGGHLKSGQTSKVVTCVLVHIKFPLIWHILGLWL